jgi:hypothetical protein
MLKKVISGGQTGVDRLGLSAAKVCGFETGGTAPKGYKTETGNNPTLKEDFGLLEDKSYLYTNRTEKNVTDSDGTVLFGDITSAGSKMTIGFIKKHDKPYIENPSSDELKTFIVENNIETLNVAGNRGSKLTDTQIVKIATVLSNTFNELKNNI